jgi:hypothetical protein
MDVLKGAQMARRKNYTPEEIVTKLRQVEVATAKGQAVALACKAAGITEQTYYRCGASTEGWALIRPSA